MPINNSVLFEEEQTARIIRAMDNPYFNIQEALEAGILYFLVFSGGIALRYGVKPAFGRG
jgi:hypothetical protein